MSKEINGYVSYLKQWLLENAENKDTEEYDIKENDLLCLEKIWENSGVLKKFEGFRSMKLYLNSISNTSEGSLYLDDIRKNHPDRTIKKIAHQNFISLNRLKKVFNKKTIITNMKSNSRENLSL